MHDEIGRCIRRLHIPPGYRGEYARCPDCGRALCRIGEGHAAMSHKCPRCKDVYGSPRMIVVILHESMRVYVDAIKLESYSIECDSALLLEDNKG